MPLLKSTLERWPLRHPFSISRHTYTESLIATVAITSDNGVVGRGECEPHDTDFQVAAERMARAGVDPGRGDPPAWLAGLNRANLGERMTRQPIRNAIDCALWDFDAKTENVRAWDLAGYGGVPVPVMPTIGIDAPATMAELANEVRGAPWLKVKVGRNDGLDAERMEAVAASAPGSALLIDANAGWTPDTLARLLPLAARLGVRIIEQPMEPRYDEQMPRPPADIAFCADESCLDRGSLPSIDGKFQYINIKLDKAGGLTEALALRAEAERRGLGVMVGMMSGTSLAVAPAFVLAQGLDVIDLELGFLKQDRAPAMAIDGWMLQPPERSLWG